MNNQISKVQQPIGELMQVAKAFAESGLFADTTDFRKAIVKIQAGQELGIPPFAAMAGIHIIKGKPTIGANLIAGRVKSSGKYNYKVIQQDDKCCSIDFYEGAEMIGNSTFTIEDAKKAQTQNLDKFARNMLFARAISNGVRWYCPDVFTTNVYTPEEMNDPNNAIDAEFTEVKDDEGKRNANANVFGDNSGNDEKPLIPNKALKDACERLHSGELKTKDGTAELYDTLLNTYTFEETQRKDLDSAWNEGCVKADKKEVVNA